MLHLAPYITPGETYEEAKERVRRTIADYDFIQALNQFASEQGMVCIKTDLPRRVPCSSGAGCTTTCC